jgi:hypothetical protein
MQLNVNIESVYNHNANAPTILRDHVHLHGKVRVEVELYLDIYKSLNARLKLDGDLVNTQWNGGHDIVDKNDERQNQWHLPPNRCEFTKDCIPKGIAQYKFKQLVGGMARGLVWKLANGLGITLQEIDTFFGALYRIDSGLGAPDLSEHKRITQKILARANPLLSTGLITLTK